MNTFLVLFSFRPAFPGCQAFDLYVEVSEGDSIADMKQAAFVELNLFYAGIRTSGDFRRSVCDPADYSIDFGPSFAETL